MEQVAAADWLRADGGKLEPEELIEGLHVRHAHCLREGLPRHCHDLDSGSIGGLLLLGGRIVGGEQRLVRRQRLVLGGDGDGDGHGKNACGVQGWLRWMVDARSCHTVTRSPANASPIPILWPESGRKPGCGREATGSGRPSPGTAASPLSAEARNGGVGFSLRAALPDGRRMDRQPRKAGLRRVPARNGGSPSQNETLQETGSMHLHSFRR